MPERFGNQSHPPAADGLAVIPFVLGPFETNCYVVHVPGAGRACWIVDASFNPDPLVGFIRAEGLTPATILLTHAHVDHIAGLENLRREFPGVPVVIHEAESGFLADPMLNLSAGLGEPITARPADRLLRGGESFDLAGTRWTVLHTPGHSPGGITLWCEPAGVAFVGDTLFAGSIGRSDFPTSDEQALVRSIREVLYALPDGTRVYPGHGPETTIGRERRTNPFVRLL